METFGARLSRLRREKGLKRSDIAEPLGMDAETVARYERDEREPKIGDAAVIAGILGVSLEYLASGVSSVQSHVFADGSGDWLLIPVLRAAEFFDAAPSKNSIAGCTDNIAVPRSIVGAVDVERPPFAFVTHDGSFEKFSIRAGSCVVVNPAEQVSDFDIALIFYKGKLALKRPQHTKNGSVRLISGDFGGSAIIVPPEDAADAGVFCIAGKAVAYRFEETGKIRHDI